MRARHLVVGLLAGLAIPAAAQVWRDPSQPVQRRVDDLASRLTLAEKAAQMQDAAPAIPRLGIPAYSSTLFDWLSDGGWLCGVRGTDAQRARGH